MPVKPQFISDHVLRKLILWPKEIITWIHKLTETDINQSGHIFWISVEK